MSKNVLRIVIIDDIFIVKKTFLFFLFHRVVIVSSILLKNASLNLSLLKNRSKIKLLKTARGKHLSISIKFKTIPYLITAHIINLIYGVCFDISIAQTLSRLSNSSETLIHRRSRTIEGFGKKDPKENYNESKLMNALFARYI